MGLLTHQSAKIKRVRMPLKALIAAPLALAIQLPGLPAAQRGTIETHDGKVLSGEIAFSKAQLTLKEESGTLHEIAASSLRLASLSHDPETIPKKPGTARHGLRGHYFKSMDLTGTPLERLDPVIDFDWQHTAPAEGIGHDNFSVRWEGEIVAPLTGEITFEAVSDDGCRLWIDGKQMIDHWHQQGAIPHSGKIVLEAKRRYAIKLEYFDANATAIIRLRWSADGLPKTIIASRNFFPPPLVGGAHSIHPHWVSLRSGSELAGTIARANKTEFLIATAEGEIRVPTPAIAHLRFTRTLAPDIATLFASRPPGGALVNHDYTQATFEEFSDGVLTLDSVLFGTQTIPQNKLRAIKLADHKPRPAALRLLTNSNSTILADEITTLPGGRLKIRDNSGYHLTIPANHIQQIRGRQD